MNNAFGQALAAALQEAGMSQSGLANQTGLSRAAISQFVLGQTTPKPQTVERIAFALGIDADRLTGAARDESTAEALQGYVNVPPAVAAKLLDLPTAAVRDGLQSGALPIGVAIRRKRHYTYCIPAKALQRFLERGMQE